MIVQGGGRAPRERRPAVPDAGDASWLRRLRLGDVAALQEVMAEYWRPLVDYAARLVDSPDVAEDVAQDAFVALWRQRSSWQPATTLRPLLYRITRNLALKEHRRQRIRLEWASRLRRDARVVATPLERAVCEELAAAFERALATLPARRREAFVLARYHELGPAEIAEVMGVSYQTAANHVTMALADLRRALGPYID